MRCSLGLTAGTVAGRAARVGRRLWAAQACELRRAARRRASFLSSSRRYDNIARRQQTLTIKENEEKIKLNKALPYLVANVVELLDAPEEVRCA